MNRSRFSLLVTLVVAAAFAGGFCSQALLGGRAARADDRPVTTTINVGSQGLVFRGPEGRTIAKLWSDPRQGGVFELYNAQEVPGARLHASSFSGSLDVFPGGGTMVAQPPSSPPPRVPGERPDIGF